MGQESEQDTGPEEENESSRFTDPSESGQRSGKGNGFFRRLLFG